MYLDSLARTVQRQNGHLRYPSFGIPLVIEIDQNSTLNIKLYKRFSENVAKKALEIQPQLNDMAAVQPVINTPDQKSPLVSFTCMAFRVGMELYPHVSIGGGLI